MMKFFNNLGLFVSTPRPLYESDSFSIAVVLGTIMIGVAVCKICLGTG